jgi:alpha-tubulin suppressor-like RCC1 family protein
MSPAPLARTSRLLAFTGLLISGGLAHGSGGSRLELGTPVIAAALTHTVMVKPNGQVWTWGTANTYGELGTGNVTVSKTPVKAKLTGVVKVAAGENFSLAVDGNSNLWSWGRNDKGQLGRGAASSGASSTPTQVDSNGNWRSVAAGPTHAVGIKMDGTLWGWGSNSSSQLCKAASTAEGTPVKLGSRTDWIAVGAGLNFTVALRADGTLWGCGTNTSGQFEKGNATGTFTTMTQVGTDHWFSFSVGLSHVVAIREDGTLWAWGLNDKGQVGDGTTNQIVSTKAQLSAWGWRTVSAGYRHNLAVKGDGTTWAWGDNAKLQLGVSDNTNPHKLMVQVGTANTGEHIATGQDSSVAIRANGQLETWGLGALLGLGGSPANTAKVSHPQPSGESSTWYTFSKPGTVAAGGSHSAAIRSDGELQTWGRNVSGQLGNGSIGTSSDDWTPSIPSEAQGTWISVAAGDDHTVAVKADGSVWAWGGNGSGQLCIGGQTSEKFTFPQAAFSGVSVLKVFAHYAQTFMLTPAGRLYACGDNINGELAIDSTDGNILSPRQVPGTFRAVSSQAHSSYFLDSRGRLYGAGQNSNGGADVLKLTRIGTGATWVAAAGQTATGYALQANGKLYEFPGTGGAVTGTTTGMTQILPGVPVAQIASMATSTLAITKGGTVYGWGDNNIGQLATGDIEDAPSSAPAVSAFWGSRTLVCGSGHALQINAIFGGFRMSAGGNSYGQLGNGNAAEGSFAADPIVIDSGF